MSYEINISQEPEFTLQVTGDCPDYTIEFDISDDDISVDFAIIGVAAESDPVFTEWLETNPLSDFLTAETDPIFASWLETNPLANYVQTDDERLSDSRTPTEHSHSMTDITDFDPDNYPEFKGDKGVKGDPGDPGAPGQDGQDGADGEEISLQVTATHIQWKLGDGAWQDLIALDELKGADGNDGADGLTPHIGLNGNWYIGEVDTGVKAVSIEFDSAVFVAKGGSDDNDGTKLNTPKLTIGSAITKAEALLLDGATGVRIHVMDGATYTENITVPDKVSIDAKGATLIGTASITGGAELFIDRHFAAANNQSMLTCEGAGTGPAIYWANISDGRGTAGTLTGVNNVRNVGGGGKNLFARVGVLYTSTSGTGVGDVSIGDAGHIHIEILDLYLAGNNSIGILGGSQGSGSANVVGWIDHILEAGTPTGTIGISMTAAGAVVKITASEIVADTAYNISAGSLYLSCPKITGTQTGTPTNRMLGSIDFGTTAGKVAEGNHVHDNAVPTGVGEKDGFLSKEDKAKLDGVATNANAYTLPVAGAALGGVKADTKGMGDTVEAKIDSSTQKLFVPTYPTVLTATTTATLTLIVANWSSKVQTLTVTGVTTTSTNLIQIDSIVMGDRWGAAKVYATSQAADEITFTCDTVPTENIEFKVVILK